MEQSSEREAQEARIEAEIAQVCGILNAATGRLVGLIGRAIETGTCEGEGIHSPEQWVAWKCGLSAGRARRLVVMARRLGELPEVASALRAGELAEDQVAVACRYAPAANDAEVATLARSATVAQLSRALRRYNWSPAAKPRADEEPEERRHIGFGTTEDGRWRISGELPVDEGALVERALFTARQDLAESGQADRPTWADALVGLAEGYLAGATEARPHRDRHMLLIHLKANGDGPNAHLHLGPALPDAVRRHLGCDGRAKAVVEAGGTVVSVGRSQRIVPERTRVAVEERDGGCRVPGCERTRWLQVHHVVHWEDGGATDTDNLIALCSRHHRLHHLGRLHITGHADDPAGMVFADERGRRLTGCGRPAPPERLQPAGKWVHPTAERLDMRWLYFKEPPQPLERSLVPT